MNVKKVWEAILAFVLVVAYFYLDYGLNGALVIATVFVTAYVVIELYDYSQRKPETASRFKSDAELRRQWADKHRKAD